MFANLLTIQNCSKLDLSKKERKNLSIYYLHHKPITYTHLFNVQMMSL